MMKPFLKDDRDERQLERQPQTRTAISFLSLLIGGAILISLFGNLSSPRTVNTFLFIVVSSFLVTWTLSGVTAIWRKK